MIVFFDIDGTIIDEATQTIPQSTIDAVRQLSENGHLAVINTGRPYTHIDPRVKAMAFGGWICGCGMEIWLNGQQIHFCAPTPEVCRLSRDAVRSSGGIKAVYELATAGYSIDGIYSDHPAIHLEASRLAEKGWPITPLDEDAPAFMKFVTFGGTEEQRRAFSQKLEPYYTVIDRGRTMLELVAKGCSKANGMEILLRHLNADPKDTLALGDSTNDLPMFRMAAHTACMGNGMDELKQAAEYITAPVLENGIAQALHHFGLI